MLDRRLPAVYVDIEDRSLAEDAPNTGRISYVVLLSDRGPHNRIVELTGRQALYDMFGKPDFMKYGQGHYLADKHLSLSSRIFVCRPAMMEPFGEAVQEDCMTIANSYIKINDPLFAAVDVPGQFGFIHSSNVIMTDTTSISTLKVGEWVFSESTDPSLARQIIKIDVIKNEVILDANYGGDTITSNLKKYNKFEISSIPSLAGDPECNVNAGDVLWYMVAVGAGEPYNDYYIKGIRNTSFEKIYTDEDGNALYPYAFMDLAIYRKNEDNTSTLLEGPWTVSLLNRTPSGSIIRDPYTGTEIYLPTVINRYSKIIKMIDSIGSNKLLTSGQTQPYDPDSQARLMVQSLFSQGKVIGRNTIGSDGVFLKSGSNGNLFESGLLNYTSEYEALVTQAYNGSLTSVDGSVELIMQEIYQWYLFDYVLCGGYGPNASNAARQLVDERKDCLLLSDTGRNSKSADEDLSLRQTDVPWNSFNAALYVQYREITDSHTGRKFEVTPVYHAIERHLVTDGNSWINDPVAGIEKGAISEPINLSYKANLTKLADLIEAEMNPVIVEPDGTYILTQFTTWKRMSIMKRQHVVKFVHYCKKRIPALLKDILQRKATQYWINQCELRVNGFMNPFIDNGNNDKYAAITSYESKIVFDDIRSEIKVALQMRMIRAIETISVNIQVV